MSLIRIQEGSLAFGHVPLLDHVELNVTNKERLCLIGRNGTGKSTLLNVLAGERALDSGQVWLRDGAQIAKLAQEVPGSATATLFEIVAQGLGDHSGLLARYHAASQSFADGGEVDEKALEAFGRLQSELESAGAWGDDAPATFCSRGTHGRARVRHLVAGAKRMGCAIEPIGRCDRSNLNRFKQDVVAGVPMHLERRR